jgi:trimeric autotransporter adhesin
MGYREVILGTSGLVAYWRLGETTGTTAADETGTNTGTYAGSCTLGVAGAIASSSNTAVSVNYGIVAVADHASLGLTTDFTFEAWVNPSLSGGNDAWVIGKDTNTGRSYCFGLRRSFSANGMILQLNGIETAGGGNAVNGSWSKIAVSRIGTSLSFYLNGVPILTTTRGDSIAVTTTGLDLGRRQYPGFEGWYFGAFDEVAIYNRGLTAAEIRRHYSEGLASAGLKRRAA